MANVIMNLNAPTYDDKEVLGSMIDLVGSMAQNLRRFQKNDFMIKSGTRNLIHIMSKMKCKMFQMRATIAIRKSTSCREEKLLDAFVKEGLIEAIVKIVHKVFGVERLNRIA